MGASESKMTVDEFLKGDDKDPIADVASALSVEMTKAAINVKDAGVKAAGEAAKKGAEAAIGAVATAAVAGAVAGPVGMVAGALATAILNGIWNAIFPPKSTEVHPAIKQIREALGQELRADTITKINGLLRDLRSRLTIDYASRRKVSNLTNMKDRQSLFDKLEEFDNRLVGVIGILMQRDYAKIGLVNFLLLASLHLALYQEMANVDPQNGDPNFNPAKSHFSTPGIGEVAAYARDYADHAENYWEQVLQDRRKQIKVTNWGRSGARVDDELTGGFQQETNKSADLLVDEYWGLQKKKLEEKFCHPKEIIANWRRLIDKPINIPDIPDEPVPDIPDQPEKKPTWGDWMKAPFKWLGGWVPR